MSAALEHGGAGEVQRAADGDKFLKALADWLESIVSQANTAKTLLVMALEDGVHSRVSFVPLLFAAKTANATFPWHQGHIFSDFVSVLSQRTASCAMSAFFCDDGYVQD